MATCGTVRPGYRAPKEGRSSGLRILFCSNSRCDGPAEKLRQFLFVERFILEQPSCRTLQDVALVSKNVDRPAHGAEHALGTIQQRAPAFCWDNATFAARE